MIFQIFQRGKPRLSYAELILDTRKYKRLAVYSMVFTGSFFAVLYLIAIFPIFYPADITNPAVLRAYTSPEYVSQTKGFFTELEMYNSDNMGIFKEPQRNYLIQNQSNLGLIVSIYLKLTPQEATENEKKLSTHGVKVKYDYVPQITIRLSPGLLVAFLIVELFFTITVIYIISNKVPNAVEKFEENILELYYSPPSSNMELPVDHTSKCHKIVEGILSNFQEFVHKLNNGRNNRNILIIENEYDVQDVVYALLRLHFSDVRKEEAVSSFVGAGSRMDFLLHNEEIGIEVKMTRDGLRDKKIGEELIIDYHRYSQHKKCKHLICFVYDPKNLITNPASLEGDLKEVKGEMELILIISPRR